MSSITKDENRDDDGEWIVNFKLSIEDVRTLYAYADFYSKHSKDLDIEHLKLSDVDKNLYWREYKNQSTEFTYTRFLVPYLQDYEGWAMFLSLIHI